jgi:hypothetical protein
MRGREDAVQIQRTLALALLLTIGLTAAAEAGFIVSCIGTDSGGSGGPNARDYAHEVVLTQATRLTAFYVNACDTDASNYTNIEAIDTDGTALAGWAVSVLTNITGGEQAADVKTPHGQVSRDWSHVPPAGVMWTGNELTAPGTYYFGFNNSRPSHDVGWGMSGAFVIDAESWAEPVGMGEGPVHGPVPEPATMALVAADVLGFVGAPTRQIVSPACRDRKGVPARSDVEICA